MPEGAGDALAQLGLAHAGRALHQDRLFHLEGKVDRGGDILGSDVFLPGRPSMAFLTLSNMGTL